MTAITSTFSRVSFFLFALSHTHSPSLFSLCFFTLQSLIFPVFLWDISLVGARQHFLYFHFFHVFVLLCRFNRFLCHIFCVIKLHPCACVRTASECLLVRQEAVMCVSKSRHETTVKQSRSRTTLRDESNIGIKNLCRDASVTSAEEGRERDTPQVPTLSLNMVVSPDKTTSAFKPLWISTSHFGLLRHQVSRIPQASLPIKLSWNNTSRTLVVRRRCGGRWG